MSKNTNRSSEGKPHWIKSLRNTAGELEQETKTRKSNLIEFFLTSHDN